MSGGNRYFIAALAGLSLAVVCNYQTVANAQAGNSTQNPASAHRAVAPTSEATEPPYRPYPHSEADTCYQERNHDAADLCAYWRAARAAERANNISYAAVILSGLALIALGITIWQTKGAVGEARRANLIAQRANARATRQALASAQQSREATEAMIIANDLTKQSLELENRAWVNLESCTFGPVSFEGGSVGFLSVSGAIKNCGAFPAQEMHLCVSAFNATWAQAHCAEQAIIQATEQRNGGLRVGGGVLAPNSETPFAIRIPLTEDRIGPPQPSPGLALRVYVVVVYRASRFSHQNNTIVDFLVMSGNADGFSRDPMATPQGCKLVNQMNAVMT